MTPADMANEQYSTDTVSLQRYKREKEENDFVARLLKPYVINLLN